jgi:hypothetical protein
MSNEQAVELELMGGPRDGAKIKGSSDLTSFIYIPPELSLELEKSLDQQGQGGPQPALYRRTSEDRLEFIAVDPSEPDNE